MLSAGLRLAAGAKTNQSATQTRRFIALLGAPSCVPTGWAFSDGSPWHLSWRDADRPTAVPRATLSPACERQRPGSIGLYGVAHGAVAMDGRSAGAEVPRDEPSCLAVPGCCWGSAGNDGAALSCYRASGRDGQATIAASSSSSIDQNDAETTPVGVTETRRHAAAYVRPPSSGPSR